MSKNTAGNKVRVLHIHASLRSGGVAILLQNYYQEMEHDRIAFDHIIHVPDVGMAGIAFQEWGSRIYHLPRFNQLWHTFWQTRRIIKKEKYQIVHVHHTQKSFVQLFAAWTCGVPVRIAHSHNYYTGERGLKYIVNRLYSLLTRVFATDYFACSEPAGKYVYGSKVSSPKYKKITNAIDVDKYILDSNVRENIRTKWGMTDGFVICHIGRITHQKNPYRLLQIFGEVLKQKKNALLLWVGTGEMEQDVKKYAEELGVSESVRFIGESKKVNELLMGADCFLLPSLYEGLGIVLVEAQVSGLPCTASDVIPSEVKLTEGVEFIPLSAPDSVWAERIIEKANKNREDQSQQIKNAGYDIKQNALALQQWYLKKASNIDLTQSR